MHVNTDGLPGPVTKKMGRGQQTRKISQDRTVQLTGEHVRETVDKEPQVINRAARPGVPECLAVLAGNVDFVEGSGHGVAGTKR